MTVAFLMAVQRIVGGIQVEDDLLRRGCGSLQKQIDEQHLNLAAVPSDPAIPSSAQCRPARAG